MAGDLYDFSQFEVDVNPPVSAYLVGYDPGVTVNEGLGVFAERRYNISDLANSINIELGVENGSIRADVVNVSAEVVYHFEWTFQNTTNISIICGDVINIDNRVTNISGDVTNISNTYDINSHIDVQAYPSSTNVTTAAVIPLTSQYGWRYGIFALDVRVLSEVYSFGLYGATTGKQWSTLVAYGSSNGYSIEFPDTYDLISQQQTVDLGADATVFYTYAQIISSTLYIMVSSPFDHLAEGRFAVKGEITGTVNQW